MTAVSGAPRGGFNEERQLAAMGAERFAHGLLLGWVGSVGSSSANGPQIDGARAGLFPHHRLQLALDDHDSLLGQRGELVVGGRSLGSAGIARGLCRSDRLGRLLQPRQRPRVEGHVWVGKPSW